MYVSKNTVASLGLNTSYFHQETWFEVDEAFFFSFFTLVAVRGADQRLEETRAIGAAPSRTLL